MIIVRNITVGIHDIHEISIYGAGILFGRYAIALSKKCGEEQRIQPARYINTEEENVSQFAKTLLDSLG